MVIIIYLAFVSFLRWRYPLYNVLYCIFSRTHCNITKLVFSTKVLLRPAKLVRFKFLLHKNDYKGLKHVFNYDLHNYIL